MVLTGGEYLLQFHQPAKSRPALTPELARCHVVKWLHIVFRQVDKDGIIFSDRTQALPVKTNHDLLPGMRLNVRDTISYEVHVICEIHLTWCRGTYLFRLQRYTGYTYRRGYATFTGCTQPEAVRALMQVEVSGNHSKCFFRGDIHALQGFIVAGYCQGCSYA